MSFTNCYEMWGAPKFGLTNVRIKSDNLIEFGINILPIIKERKLQKKGEILKKTYLIMNDW